MFFPFTYEYRHFDAHYVGVVWPYAELLGAAAAALMGLLSLWLVFGQQFRWYVRLLPVLLVLFLACWIPAYDLCASAGIQCVVLVLLQRLAKIRKLKQIELSELLLLVLLVGIVLGVVKNFPEYWKGIMWFGVGFGILTWISWLIASKKGVANHRFKSHWLLAVLLPSVAVMVIWLRLVKADRQRQSQAAFFSFRRFALPVFSITVAAPVVAAFAFLLYRAPIPRESPPTANSLPELIAIGRDMPFGRFRRIPTGQARTRAVAELKDSLDAARELLGRDGWLGVNYDIQDLDDYDQRCPHRDPVFNISWGLLAEATVAESEKRFGDALSSYRDLLGLFALCARGGLPFDATLAAECEADSLGHVYMIREQMSGEQCRSWARFLVEREPVFESTNLILNRRFALVDRRACWQDRLVLWLLRRMSISLPELNLEFVEKDRGIYVGLQAIDFALRAFQLENSTYPTSLSELVPHYLPELPMDPVNPNGFSYHKTDGDYRLYSIGNDGVDDTSALRAGNEDVADGDVAPSVVLSWCQ